MKRPFIRCKFNREVNWVTGPTGIRHHFWFYFGPLDHPSGLRCYLLQFWRVQINIAFIGDNP